jgi:hypothetical protein
LKVVKQSERCQKVLLRGSSTGVGEGYNTDGLIGRAAVLGERERGTECCAGENPYLVVTLGRSHGFSPPFADLAIAAIAKHHDLAILTCNLKHYTPLGVAAHDPVAKLPPSTGFLPRATDR